MSKKGNEPGQGPDSPRAYGGRGELENLRCESAYCKGSIDFARASGTP